MAVQPGEIVLSFPSHRLRDRSGIARDPQATAVYSFRRASYGYYRLPAELAAKYRRPGVTQLRGP